MVWGLDGDHYLPKASRRLCLFRLWLSEIARTWLGSGLYVRNIYQIFFNVKDWFSPLFLNKSGEAPEQMRGPPSYIRHQLVQLCNLCNIPNIDKYVHWAHILICLWDMLCRKIFRAPHSLNSGSDMGRGHGDVRHVLWNRFTFGLHIPSLYWHQ